MSEVEWRKLRADQLRAAAKQDAIVILPVGSIEQHGPHLPVEVDSMLGEQVALRTARKLVKAGHPALVLPNLWTGVSEHHMSFGGTITLDLPTFCAVLEQIVKSVLRHGFKRVVLLNGHGGNENLMRSVTDELTPKYRAPIVEFTYWYAAAEAIGAILETQGNVLHACEAETAMMMAVRPELVAEARIPLAKSNQAPDMPPGIYRWRTLGAVSSSGVVGNPEAASAEKGQRLLEAISDTIAAKLGDEGMWALPWDHETVT